MKRKQIILNISLSGMFIALGLLLPFLTGQIPEIGAMLCPMHIPVLICGFVCGYKYGLVVGFITPLLRNVIFGMPTFYPTALSMAFELATYACIAGILYQLSKKFNKNTILSIYIILIISMLGGRIVWGLVRFIMASIDKSFNFTLEVFITGAFISAWPGIILQLIIIPILIKALEKTDLLSYNS